MKLIVKASKFFNIPFVYVKTESEYDECDSLLENNLFAMLHEIVCEVLEDY